MEKTNVKRIQRTSAVQKALQNLREYIRQTKTELLPNEDDLAKDLGVSRLTVREAITVLESEGLVSRMQGKGTQINLFVSKLQNRIDISSDIEGCLRDNGYDVKFKVVSMVKKTPNERECFHLKLQPEDKILVIEKLLYANEIVAAVYIDRVPLKYIKKEEFKKSDFEPSIFPVIEDFCEVDITHDVVEIKPSLADGMLATYFNIEVKTPLIKYETLEYTSQSIAIMYNTEYYTDQFISFTICRNVSYKDKRKYNNEM